MEPLIAKVKAILGAEFPGSRDEIEERVPGYRVGGSFIWPGFVGMPQIDRQHLVREALRKHLTAEEDTYVGLLLTFTPREVAAMDEAVAA